LIVSAYSSEDVTDVFR
jgi:hypothetical protein